MCVKIVDRDLQRFRISATSLNQLGNTAAADRNERELRGNEKAICSDEHEHWGDAEVVAGEI